MIRIVRATGLATVQDRGWRTGRAVGLPPGGAMDPAALELANVLVGNDPGAAGLELAIGELDVEVDGPIASAVTGAVGAVTLDGAPVSTDTTLALAAGQRLSIGRAKAGRFGYLAFEGGIEAPPVLGSRATYLPTALGGWEGRRLTAGDRLPLGRSQTKAPPPGTTSLPLSRPAEDRIRVTAASQSYLFPEAAFAALVDQPYRVTPASDRMGSRLEGAALPIKVSATLPSEGTCLGAIQVPDNGQPIVVLRDGPTVGGYPKIGVVIGADLARFCQVPLGDPVHFKWVSIDEAQRLHRVLASDLARRFLAIREAARP